MNPDPHPPAPAPRSSRVRWEAVALVAAVYVVFLLYAQFGFLHGVHASGHGTDAVHLILGLMALTGIAGSLAAPRIARAFAPAGTTALGLLLCAGAATSSGLAFHLGEGSIGHLAIAATGLGAGLGLATVGLAADLRRLTGARAVATHVGAGTATAYFVCNVPAVFAAAPPVQAGISAGCALAALGAVWSARTRPDPAAPAGRGDGELPSSWGSPWGISIVTALFFPLVWFDSSAFAALQADPAEQARLWSGSATLWRNGGLHAVAALAAGWIIDRGRLRSVLAGALALLIVGAAGFPAAGWTGRAAVPLYIAGVSAYSTALAAFAALLPARPAQPAPIWRAVWLYAVAGWIASSAGVGLVEQSGDLPPWAAPAAAAFFMAALALSARHRFAPAGGRPSRP